jgi:Uma2 family endonuclease
MVITAIKPLTLEDFLQQSYIDDSPAYEYINNQVSQKPMPQTHHSRLQLKLATAIDSYGESSQIALAFPELRCNFGGRSIVPDIAVILWEKIPFNDNDEPENSPIFFAPDWSIEILSPSQKYTKVIDNILFCLEHGSQIGWLIDPEERLILVFQPQKAPVIYRDDQQLPVLKNLDLQLTPNQIFSWLKLPRKQDL